MSPKASTLTPAGERWVKATARPLDVLAIVFLVDLLLMWSFPGASPQSQAALNLIAWAVWAGFAVDYVARLLLSHPRSRFILSHKIDLLMVLLPMLRVLRVFLLLRRSLATVSTDKIAGSIVSIVVGVVFTSAFLVWRVEYDAPGASITTFREALWWAIVTTTTVGYGDYTPVTQIGRLIAMLVMIVGIGLIGTISATVASYFVNRPKSKDASEGAASQADANPTPVTDAAHADLIARLDTLAVQQAEIRTMLARLPLT